MDADFFLALQVNQAGDGRRNRRLGNRMDPREAVSNENEFRRHFRMSMENAQAIVELIEQDISFHTNRGNPLSPMQQFCITMLTFGGGNFQRVSGLAEGVAQNTARLAIVRVCDALCRLKPDVVHMPSVAEMEATAQAMLDEFGLPDFALGVDGCVMRFEDKPRGLPAGKDAQMFWNRKQCYALNVQFVCNDKQICDIDVGWHGATHDAKIWNRSEVKEYIEQQRRFLVAGDSGYPISEVLMKPYSEPECVEEERAGASTKRRFNHRLSGLRTVLTEHHFGRLKKRFPILRQLRTHLELSQKTIIACSVVHNLLTKWNDPLPDDVVDDVDEQQEEEFVVEDDGDLVARRVRGQAKRDAMRLAMP